MIWHVFVGARWPCVEEILFNACLLASLDFCWAGGFNLDPFVHLTQRQATSKQAYRCGVVSSRWPCAVMWCSCDGGNHDCKGADRLVEHVVRDLQICCPTLLLGLLGLLGLGFVI